MSKKRVEKWLCPSCGLERVVPVLIGLPTAEDGERARKGEVILHGCIVFGNEPDRPVQCTECGWYGERIRGGKIREFVLEFPGIDH